MFPLFYFPFYASFIQRFVSQETFFTIDKANLPGCVLKTSEHKSDFRTLCTKDFFLHEINFASHRLPIKNEGDVMADFKRNSYVGGAGGLSRLREEICWIMIAELFIAAFHTAPLMYVANYR